MSYLRPLAVLFAASFSACDPAAGDSTGDASTTAADSETGYSTGGLPHIPLPCATIGDGCMLVLGDEQCGERMACVHLSGQHPQIGTCVAPCSEATDCAIGKCQYEIGVCFGDASELVASVACE